MSVFSGAFWLIDQLVLVCFNKYLYYDPLVPMQYVPSSGEKPLRNSHYPPGNHLIITGTDDNLFVDARVIKVSNQYQ